MFYMVRSTTTNHNMFNSILPFTGEGKPSCTSYPDCRWVSRKVAQRTETPSGYHEKWSGFGIWGEKKQGIKALSVLIIWQTGDRIKAAAHFNFFVASAEDFLEPLKFVSIASANIWTIAPTAINFSHWMAILNWGWCELTWKDLNTEADNFGCTCWKR